MRQLIPLFLPREGPRDDIVDLCPVLNHSEMQTAFTVGVNQCIGRCCSFLSFLYYVSHVHMFELLELVFHLHLGQCLHP